MRCQSCASDIPESSRFCLVCGAPALILILGVTAWAFRNSVAGRPLFRDTILEAEAPASR